MTLKNKFKVTPAIFVILFMLLLLSWFTYKAYSGVHGLWLFLIITALLANDTVLRHNSCFFTKSFAPDSRIYKYLALDNTKTRTGKHWLIEFFANILYFGVSFFAMYSLLPCFTLAMPQDSVAPQNYIVPFLITAFAALFAARSAEAGLNAAQKTDQPVESFHMLYQLRAIVFFSFALVIAYGLRVSVNPAFYYFTRASHYISLAVHAFIFIFALEICAVSFFRFLFLFKKQAWSSQGRTIYSAQLFFSSINPLSSFKTGLNNLLGINIFQTQALEFCLKTAEPMFVSALIIFWLLTSIVIIPPDKQGIIRRFSKIIHKEPAGPGLHIKSPWPIDTVQLYTPQRVNILNIGFIPSKEKKHIIWTKPHAVENFNLVLGNGMEMISVDCQVMYKIKDLNNYVIQFQNPEQLIEAAAYRALTFETVGSTFDEVMVRDRSQFARALKNDIQNLLDNCSSGIEIVEIVFVALHPPLELADAYEDVISSQTDMKTRVLAANADREYSIAMAKASSLNIINRAKSYEETKTADSLGQANSFLSRTMAYRFEPELVRYRMRLEKMQRAFSSKKLYIVDNSVLEQENTFFLDLRDSDR